jgi:hypothetical protein
MPLNNRIGLENRILAWLCHPQTLRYEDMAMSNEGGYLCYAYSFREDSHKVTLKVYESNLAMTGEVRYSVVLDIVGGLRGFIPAYRRYYQMPVSIEGNYRMWDPHVFVKSLLALHLNFVQAHPLPLALQAWLESILANLEEDIHGVA